MKKRRLGTCEGTILYGSNKILGESKVLQYFGMSRFAACILHEKQIKLSGESP